MPVGRCPHCKSRYIYNNYDTDIMHTCNSGSVGLDNEDKFNMNHNPVAPTNKLFGTTPQIVHHKQVLSVTPRHNHEITTTTRQRQVYIDLRTGRVGLNPVR